MNSLYAIILWLLSLISPAVAQPPVMWTPPVGIERAVQRMGPAYQYRIAPDGVLYVWIEGKWLRLSYKPTTSKGLR